MPSFRLKRGDATKVGSYVGNEGELIYNTETKKVHVMDGTTSGGAVVAGTELVDAPGNAEGVGVGRATTDWDSNNPRLEPMVESRQYASNSTHLFVAVSTNDEVYALPHTALSNHPSTTDLVEDLYANDRTWTVPANSLYLDPGADTGGMPYTFPTCVAANDSIVVVGSEYALQSAGATGKAFILNAQTGALIAELVPPANSGGFGAQVAITSSYIYVMQKYIDYMDMMNSQVQIFVFEHSGTFVTKVEPMALDPAPYNYTHFVVNDDVIAVWHGVSGVAHVWPISAQGIPVASPMVITRSYDGANSDPMSARMNLFSNNVLVFGDKGNVNYNAGYLQFNQIQSADNPFDSFTTTHTISHPSPIEGAMHNWGVYSRIQKLSSGEEFLIVAENGVGHVDNTQGMAPFGMQFVWAVKSDSSLFAGATSFNPDTAAMFKEHTNAYAGAWMEPIPVGDRTLLITSTPENNFAVMDFTFGTGGKQLKSGQDLITIPTKLSQLTNDSSFATSADIPTALSQLSNDVGFSTGGGGSSVSIQHHLETNSVTLGPSASQSFVTVISHTFTAIPEGATVVITVSGDIFWDSGNAFPTGGYFYFTPDGVRDTTFQRLVWGAYNSQLGLANSHYEITYKPITVTGGSLQMAVEFQQNSDWRANFSQSNRPTLLQAMIIG